jgi:hypothetical protein
MSREIMQQALDKFEHLWEIGIDAEYKVDLMPEIRALRTELAKPEHNFDMPEAHIVKWSIPVDPNNFGEPLAQPEQVPVAYVEKGDLYWCDDTSVYDAEKLDGCGLYTKPPRKPWVGLTDEELNLIYAEPQTHAGQYARAIEAKLKELNHAHT